MRIKTQFIAVHCEAVLSPTGPLYGHTVDLDQHHHGIGVGDPPNNVGKDDTAGKLDPYAIQ